ncbi:hypothetical protein BASA61_006960 [Batrachochytrium salamandrivorans]|nr:hypothetical protein BASA60_006538 [Batrachochytrium salamandrivorans]KAH6585232.1 hypothetical protein BASA61_006960 [Batrachochytrium salamandrivorans]
MHFRIDQQAYRTRTHHQNNDPSFNETFRFNIINNQTMLFMELHDDEIGPDSHLGIGTLDLNSTFQSGTFDGWVPFTRQNNGSPSGDVRLVLQFYPMAAHGLQSMPTMPTPQYTYGPQSQGGYPSQPQYNPQYVPGMQPQMPQNMLQQPAPNYGYPSQTPPPMVYPGQTQPQMGYPGQMPPQMGYPGQMPPQTAYPGVAGQYNGQPPRWLCFELRGGVLNGEADLYQRWLDRDCGAWIYGDEA